MTLPVKFRKSRERAIASFPFTDIADNTGIEIFFCAIGETSGGKTYHLISKAITSTGEPSDKTLVNGEDVDFDTTVFNLPRTVRGTAILSGELNVVSAAAISITATVLKFDGSTETAISSTITSQTAGSTGSNGLLLKIPLTETIIKKGELIRLTIVVTANGGSNLFADPIASGGVALRLLMPFKIDL